MSRCVEVMLTEAELEALKEVLRRSIQGPCTPDDVGTAYDKVCAALSVIAEDKAFRESWGAAT